MNGKLSKGISAGLLSGLGLGLFLKIIQQLTGIQVYTLLLNVDFLPYIGAIQWPEWMEFGFHLIVSLILGIILSYGIKRCPSWNVYAFACLLTFPTIFLYFPLSILAIKTVPTINNMTAFSLWTTGHVLYALLLAFCYQSIGRKYTNP